MINNNKNNNNNNNNSSNNNNNNNSMYIFCGKSSTNRSTNGKSGLILSKMFVAVFRQNKCPTQTFKNLWKVFQPMHILMTIEFLKYKQCASHNILLFTMHNS